VSGFANHNSLLMSNSKDVLLKSLYLKIDVAFAKPYS